MHAQRFRLPTTAKAFSRLVFLGRHVSRRVGERGRVGRNAADAQLYVDPRKLHNKGGAGGGAIQQSDCRRTCEDSSDGDWSRMIEWLRQSLTQTFLLLAVVVSIILLGVFLVAKLRGQVLGGDHPVNEEPTASDLLTGFREMQKVR